MGTSGHMRCQHHRQLKPLQLNASPSLQIAFCLQRSLLGFLLCILNLAVSVCVYSSVSHIFPPGACTEVVPGLWVTVIHTLSLSLLIHPQELIRHLLPGRPLAGPVCACVHMCAPCCPCLCLFSPSSATCPTPWSLSARPGPHFSFIAPAPPPLLLAVLQASSQAGNSKPSPSRHWYCKPRI